MIVNFINYLKDLIGPFYYKLDPKIFGRGYERYKIDLIKKSINNIQVDPITYIDERLIEIPWTLKKLSRLNGKLLDAGSTLNFEYIIKKLSKNFKIYIQTLYPEKKNYPNLGVKYFYKDLLYLDFKKNYFDVVTCISTLEHIGFDNSNYNYSTSKIIDKKVSNKHIKVFKNLFKVLKPNGKLLITVPYGMRGNYINLQQFDRLELNRMFKSCKIKKLNIEYYLIKNNRWKKVKMQNCKNIEPKTLDNEKTRIVLSSNSIALIEITK
tara:strand:+ start:2189 stop:2986 length:798 start_codon:yes stop_codon:yes gene_type:complete